MNKKGLVSVVIPTYNRAELVVNCIKSVFDSSYNSIEVIVVDNASTDDTILRIESLREDADSKKNIEGYKIIALAENVMASGGRNVGIIEAGGEYILFLDDDNEIYSDMIEKLVEFIHNDDNEETGLVAPLAFNVSSGGKVTWTTSISYNWWTSRCKNTYPECVGKTEETVDAQFERYYETWAGSPNAFMIPRNALEAVGGFDFSMYMTYEEGDFACRIRKAGYKEYIYCEARTNHILSERQNENYKLRHLCIDPANRALYFCRNRTVFMRRYARWYHRIIYYLIFFHLFTIYYALMALSEKRFDIVRAVVCGAWAGIFVKNDSRIYIPIRKADYRYK